MPKPIPWKAPAAIAVKRRGEAEFHPKIAGLTLNAALDYAINADLPPGEAICLWVNWHGEEVWVRDKRILQLAADPDRPPLASS